MKLLYYQNIILVATFEVKTRFNFKVRPTMPEFKTVSRSMQTKFLAKLEIDIKDIDKKYEEVDGKGHLIDRRDFNLEFSNGSQINGYLQFVYKNRVSEGVYIIFHDNGNDEVLDKINAKGKLISKFTLFLVVLTIFEKVDLYCLKIARFHNVELS